MLQSGARVVCELYLVFRWSPAQFLCRAVLENHLSSRLAATTLGLLEAAQCGPADVFRMHYFKPICIAICTLCYGLFSTDCCSRSCHCQLWLNPGLPAFNGLVKLFIYRAMNIHKLAGSIEHPSFAFHRRFELLVLLKCNQGIERTKMFSFIS
jgi:hypothetical protein